MRLFELGVRDSFDLWDSVWVLLLSITTVGYGDLYPKSDLGRTVLICNQLVGVVILSTLVAVVQQSLSLSNRCEHVAYYANLNNQTEVTLFMLIWLSLKRLFMCICFSLR